MSGVHRKSQQLARGRLARAYGGFRTSSAAIEPEKHRTSRPDWAQVLLDPAAPWAVLHSSNAGHAFFLQLLLVFAQNRRLET
jgi:hypothetical protein